jgi:hypothetical protein
MNEDSEGHITNLARLGANGDKINHSRDAADKALPWTAVKGIYWDEGA